ncbi:MAG: hypothetical protein ACEPOZ_02660 [Marinifilaceae bacterium]
MNKIYKLEKEKNLIITADYIAISSKNYKDYEEMKKKSEMISLKDSFTFINKKNLHELSYNLEEGSIKLKYSSEIEINDKIQITPLEKQDLKLIADEVQSNFRLNKEIKSENKIKPIFTNGLSVIVAAAISWVMVSAAFKMQNGETIEISGRRSGIKKLLISFVDFLGPYGTTAVCLLIIGYYIYKLIKRFKNPSDLVLIKK